MYAGFFSGFGQMFARLEGKPEQTLEKTRELTLLHWGTLALYLTGMAAVMVSFSEVGFFPFLALATAGGFVYSWVRAGKPRRKEDALLGACLALVLLMIYGTSLGRVYTAASVATIVAAAAADAGVFMSYRLKRARDYRVVMVAGGAMAVLSALSYRAVCIPFIALYLVLLLPVGLQSNLEHLRRREKRGSLTQAVQGKGMGVLATYVLPALVVLAAAALLYLAIPKPLRSDLESSGSAASGSVKPDEGSGSGSSGSGSGSSGTGSTSSGGSGDLGEYSGDGGGSGGGSGGSGSGSGQSGSGQSGSGSGSGQGSGDGDIGESGSGGGGTGQGSGSGQGGGTGQGSGSGQGSGTSQGSGSGESGGGSSRGVVREKSPEMTEEEQENINNSVLKMILFLLLAMALAAAAYYIYKILQKRKKKQEPRVVEAARQAAFKAQRQGEFVCLTYAAMCDEVARLGFARAPADTPAEYLRTISQRVPSVENEAGTITGALVDLLYAGRVPESSVLAKLDALLAQVRGKIAARLAAEEQAAR